MEFHVNDLRVGYHDVVRGVIDLGSFEKDTIEILGAHIIIEDVYDTMPVGVGRGVNQAIGAAEAVQLIAGRSEHWLLERISPNFVRYPQTHGAYGPRLAEQYGFVLRELRRDPSSRRAVMTIWDPVKDTVLGLTDYPCTTALQFFIREGFLDMQVYMRSNDVWKGLAYDAFQFTQLQLSIADELGAVPGAYRHFAASLHLYKSDLDKAETMLRGPVKDYDDIESSLVPPAALTRTNAGLLLNGAKPVPGTSPTFNWYYEKLGRYLARR